MSPAQKKSTFMRMFPPPTFLQMSAAGLDITDQRVRCLKFKQTLQGLEVEKYGEEKIAPGVIVAGRLKRPDEIKRALTVLGKKYNLQFVRVSLPEERAYLVKMEVPDVRGEELRNAIAFQLEEYVPVPAGEAVFDYHILGNTKGREGYLNVAVLCKVM